MHNTTNDKLIDDDNEINLIELVYIIWNRRKLVTFITALISILGLIYSLLLPNIYESKALLSPATAESSISRSLNSYRGFAGLAGINVTPDQSAMGNTEKAKEKIKSLSFFEENILKNIYLPDLMAVDSWDSELNVLNYDKKIFDDNNKTWVRKYSHPQLQIPSAQESFKVFTENHLNITDDKKSGFITLSIKHQSPIIAKNWVELHVDQINNYYRKKDKLESEKAISYLNKQILMTDLSEIKEAIAELLKEETKKLSLIEANKFYVFEYIDPPAVMELKSEPKRALICIFISFLGFVLSVVFVLLRQYVFLSQPS